jgi:hypothetical protein
VNDLALLRLSNPSSIAPISWLPATMSSLEVVGTPVVFAGYGRTETGDLGTKLWVDGEIAEITSTGLKNEQDDLTGTCGGDSGGPLIYDFGGTWYVGGTTSWGDSACTDYGWSMRVSAFDGWVTDFIGFICTGDADCDDGDACTTDTCTAGVCANAPMDCSDGDACTTDSCVYGACVHGSMDCDDDNVCTVDSCDPSLGCTYVDQTGSCDDGDACTLDDACVSGVCTGDLDPACACGAKKDPCSSDGDCCSNRCVKGVCR